ncbi:hypothetical protein SK128_007105 [Halocaridina rubra]|uniref:C-type lectin domain-containing protein n=1 Tax=Halocaridina rubra TaxID=373956 RepID=A0AAN9A1R4_HALRR
MTQVVKETLAKSTRHLEKLRRSSLGYLDAAVTSISSSAVASAQSTTMQLKEALKALDMHVGEKLHKLQSSMSQLVTVCPPKYTNVGGTCLLAFSDLLTTWETARQICHQERGDLILIPDAEMMNHLQVFVYSTHAKNTDVAPPYWVGARKRESQWWWLNECLVTLKISDATLPDTLQNINNTQNSTDNGDECLMSWGTGAELLRSSCDSLRAVLCQYQSHYANVTSEISNDQIIDEIKHSTEQPNIILEPDNNALNFDTQYDYLTYSFK